MESHWWAIILTGVDYLIVITLVPRIISERRDSAATLAWVMAIVFVPFLGALFYVVFGARRLSRHRVLRRVRSESLAVARSVGGTSSTRLRAPDGVTVARDIGLSSLPGAFAPTTGNTVRFLTEAELTYAQKLEAIAEARDHVHLLYFIFKPDHIGMRFLRALEERARAGVEVRLLVDAIGSLALKRRYCEPLIAAGGKVGVFNPVSLRTLTLHLRNHRKILVVDGQVAFTGGLNVADMFRRRYSSIGPWRDTHLMIRGPAAADLQDIFVEDWHFATGEQLVAERYFPAPKPAGESVVQIVASGPDTGAESIQRAIFASINAARDRAWMTTPYFIPDQALLVSLKVAAQRGVDVRILLPGKGDHPLVFWAGRSFYTELLEAGVKVYEYQAGMVHAKLLMVDGKWAIAGSANLDRRSFTLNFEASAVLYDTRLVAELEEAFDKDLEAARRVVLPLRRTRLRQAVEAASYILAPLL